MPTQEEWLRREAEKAEETAGATDEVAKNAVTVVNKSQQVRTAALSPDPAYSRLIALELHIPAGIGNEDFCFTPPLGNTLILYGIDLWMRCPAAPIMYGGFVYLTYGAGVPLNAGEVITSWTNIVPLHCGLKPGFRMFACGHIEMHFPMKKRFVKDEIRFGAAMENFVNQAWEATVLFQISEG